MKHPVARSLGLGVLLAAPSLAQAHPGHVEFSGLVAGLSHPVAGLDHLLAMLAVGLWAAQLGGKARWLLPMLFVTAMLAGAGLGIIGIAVPGVEHWIVASVMALGLLLLWARRVPLVPGAVLVAAFAAMHGVAHGAEMPGSADMMLYMLGFAVSTALLHAAGIALVSWRGVALSRVLGAGIAIAGLSLGFV